MHIHQIIGQLFILGFQGKCSATTDVVLDCITQNNLGGVILFDHFVSGNNSPRNIESTAQVQQLATHLQLAASEKLFIAIDQEGGKVCRLKPRHGFFSQPSAKSLGEGTLDTSRKVAAQTAKALKALGINLNFAPTADLAVNPENPVIGALERSFSAKADIVTGHCRVWLEEYRRAGIFGCLKHFPGHGSSTLDSHKHFVDISDTWQNKELSPYSILIQEDLVDIIMVGHLYNRYLDPNYPAPLSQPILQGLLRRQLGFHGLIISDDMQMQAIVSRYGLPDACLLALKCGIDMIIIGNNLQYDADILHSVTRRIMRGLEKNEISEKRIQDAYAKISSIKKRLC